jgi:hypothetical protein
MSLMTKLKIGYRKIRNCVERDRSRKNEKKKRNLCIIRVKFNVKRVRGQ